MPPDDAIGLPGKSLQTEPESQSVLSSSLETGASGRVLGSLERFNITDAVDLSQRMDLNNAFERVSKAANSGITTTRDLKAVLDIMLPLQEVRSPVVDVLPKFMSQIRRGKTDSATALFRAARSTMQLQTHQPPKLQLALRGGTTLPPAGLTTIEIVVLILSAIAALIAIGREIKELAEAAEGDPATKCWDVWKGVNNFDSANVRIKKFACDSTIEDLDDGVVVIIDEIPKGCTVTISGNDGTVRIKENKGTLVIDDNDDSILIDSNSGTVDINGNDDTIVIDSNNEGAEVKIDGNADSIGVNTNDGTTTVNGNDDTVSVNKNTSKGSIDINGNNDTVNVNNNGGKLDVDGNSGGTLDDADVNVVDNSMGTINANNNDGNINVGADSKGNQGTINRGNKPGDIQKL